MPNPSLPHTLHTQPYPSYPAIQRLRPGGISLFCTTADYTLSQTISQDTASHLCQNLDPQLCQSLPHPLRQLPKKVPTFIRAGHSPLHHQLLHHQFIYVCHTRRKCRKAFAPASAADNVSSSCFPCVPSHASPRRATTLDFTLHLTRHVDEQHLSPPRTSAFT